MPEVERSRPSCRQLNGQIRLPDLFTSLLGSVGSPVHHQDFGQLLQRHSCLLESISDSPFEDLDYCVRSVAFVGRSLQPRNSMIPLATGPSHTSEDQEQPVVPQFMAGLALCLPSEVINYVDDIVGFRTLADGQIRMPSAISSTGFLIGWRPCCTATESHGHA